MNKSLSVLLIAILATVVLTAAGTYFLTVHYNAPTEQATIKVTGIDQSTTTAELTEKSTGKLESVEVLLIGLKQRLKAQKNDIDGWILLSKSYYHINRLSEAEEAFEQALALGYAGTWKPLPQIDSFNHNDFSAQNLKAMINSRDLKTAENSSQ